MGLNQENSKKTSLSGKICFLAAGCYVDEEAMKRWNTDLATLKKMGEAYRAGWLHNVMGRVTPLTMINQKDYLAIADLFVDSAAEAEKLLNRFDQGLEHYCQCANIQIMPNTSLLTLSPKVRAHVQLYMALNQLLTQKFGVAERDPISVASGAEAGEEADFNPYIREYVEQRFNA